jgi:hypothetical protein
MEVGLPLVMCRVFEVKKYSNYETVSQKNKNYLIFSKAFLLNDVNMIEELKSLTLNYINSIN